MLIKYITERIITEWIITDMHFITVVLMDRNEWLKLNRCK